jgi:hypothetical protein
MVVGVNIASTLRSTGRPVKKFSDQKSFTAFLAASSKAPSDLKLDQMRRSKGWGLPVDHFVFHSYDRTNAA